MAKKKDGCWDKVRRIMEAALKHGEPVLVEGPPGCGKTSMPLSIAAAWGWRSWVLTTSLCEPSDILGLPARDPGDKVAQFLPIGPLAEVLAHEGPGVLVLDDVGHARQDVQAALWPLIFERRIGSRPIPPGIRVVLTANRQADAGAGARAMLTPMRTRIPVIQTLTGDQSATIRHLREKYAADAEQSHSWVAALLVASEELTETNWNKNSSREWELACRWLNVAQATVPPQDDPTTHSDFILDPMRANASAIDLDSWLADIARAWAIAHLVKAILSGGTLPAPDGAKRSTFAMPAARVLAARGEDTDENLQTLAELCGGVSFKELRSTLAAEGYEHSKNEADAAPAPKATKPTRRRTRGKVTS